MKFNNYAYIFLGPNLDAKKNRMEMKLPQLTFTTIGLDFTDKECAIEIAKELVANGAQMIELCGGFGPIWIAKIYAALGEKIPVGGVMYGPEARKPMLDLLS